MRIGLWVAGLVVGVALASVIPESVFPGVRPVVLGSALLFLGLLGELVDWFRSRKNLGTRDTRPADGRVDLAAVGGVVREPNPADRRFGRFVGREPFEPTKARPADRQSPPLLGRVVLVSLFIGRDGRPWSATEIADAHGAVARAGAWIEREAARYGAGVNVELADTYFAWSDDEADEVVVGFAAEGNDVGPLEEGATRKALVGTTRAAVALGFQDAPDLFREVEARIGADAVVWLIHPRRVGRSFAVPREDSPLTGVSVAVCYPKESSFPEPLTGRARVDPVTLVHETLHLFGATDKYGRPLRSFAPGTVSAREVMRLSASRLSRLRVDPGTAAEIGWPAPGPESTTAVATPLGSRRPSVD